ncbi:basic helix-loop-helix (bHLH) DNA-binding superfamily protein [Wolffia australiana]
MEKEAGENYPLAFQPQNNLGPLDYSLEQQEINQLLRPRDNLEGRMEMTDFAQDPPPQRQISLDRISFAEVMQFADFGPKLAFNQSKIAVEDKYLQRPAMERSEEGGRGGESKRGEVMEGGKSKRKRPRSLKTTEEVEIQRMTHIAVERNRRKQMNEHLRVLRSLMPSSYVQRGDQASIIGGAIDFVRELEQLLQCLESQKQRRMGGGEPQRPPGEAQTTLPPFFAGSGDQMKASLPYDGATAEEAAESKSCLADVEVKVLGFDAMIKILSRRRPGQLLRTIAALEDLQLNILHTNITTIEQTVLYSFNVKITGEVRFTAEDMASSIQQIFSLINAGAI